MLKRIDDIQILRALAAMAVLFFHVEREIFTTTDTGLGRLFADVAWLGQVGVDIFFVISGFIMFFVHHCDFARPQAPRRFFLRRLDRIVPAYWLLTTVTVAGLILLPGLFNSRSLDWPWIAASYLFIPWSGPGGAVAPPLGPGWTLNYEMYFYVIFAALLLLPRRVALPAITAFMVASAGVGLIFAPSHPVLALMTSAMLIEFLCGIWLAWAFLNNITLSTALRAGLLAVAAAVFAVSPTLYTSGDLSTWWRLAFFGLPSAALMAVILLRSGLIHAPEQSEGWLHRLFVKLGNSSYALYLTHVFTLRIVGVVLHRLAPTLPPAIGFVLLFAVAVVVSRLFFVLVERPLYRFLRARLGRASGAQVPA